MTDAMVKLFAPLTVSTVFFY